MSVLVQVSDSGLGRKFALGEVCLIGRTVEADIQVVDGLVSKRHAQVVELGEGHTIEDLGSRNGVLLNNVRVQGATRLKPNDVISIGEATFLYAPNLEILPFEDHAVILVDDGDLPSSAVTQSGVAGSSMDSFLGRTDDLGTVLSQLLAWLKDKVPFGSAGLMRVSAQGFEPVCLSAADRTVSLPKSLLQAVLDRAEIVCVPDAAASRTFQGGQSIAGQGLRSLIAAPLKLGKEVIGVVFLHDGKPGSYDARHVQTLRELLPSIATVLGLWERQRTLAGALTSFQTLAQSSESIIGESEPWREIKALISKVSAVGSPVLIQGESGTGKELVARELHNKGRSASEPFVAINCGAIPEQLMESEIFGYEKGAFTGAVKRTPGKLELAQRGTLFLDEIGDLTLSMQVKLLRALQERQFYRLSGAQPVKVECRILAATHRDLRAMVGAGTFREDLFYRLNVINLTLPPLREHASDVALLTGHLLRKISADLHAPARSIDAGALSALTRYAWPGNVRELHNVLERMLVLCDHEVLTVDDLPPEILAAHGQEDAPLNATLPDQLARLEKRLISSALKKARGKKVNACRALGISRPTLDKKIKDYGIDLYASEE